MFNVMHSGFFLLGSIFCIPNISVCGDQKTYGYDHNRYKVSCEEENFEGKTYLYDVMVECARINNAEIIKKEIKNVRGGVVLFNTVFNYQGTYPEINERIGDCSVDIYCINIHNGERLAIGDPNIEKGLKAGTHQLKATTVRIDGSSHQ